MNIKSIATAALGLLFSVSLIAAPKVKVGIEVLKDRGFEGLQGKKIGLVTNPSGVDSQLNSTIDILNSAPGVELKALFAPEHGVRGDAYAGDKVDNAVDPKTGVKVYSIFGKYRKPSPEMLEGLDVMVYDIQDIGSRSYTFISTLGLIMRACAEKGIEVMVLDRPNPLGGNKIEGSYVEDGCYSFVSEFKIPYIYGLTVGELALLLNEEGLNCGEKGNEEPLSCKLTVVPMEGWNRKMTYDKTGLPWILPSPNIPSEKSALYYPTSGILGEFQGYLNIGVGYTLPFQVFAAEWMDADALKAELDSYNLPGIEFRVIHFKPFWGADASKLIHGVQFYFSDWEAAEPTLVNFYVMQAVGKLYPERNPFNLSKARNDMFDKVCGSTHIREAFSKDLKVEEIAEYWRKDNEAFKLLSKKYYLYK